MCATTPGLSSGVPPAPRARASQSLLPLPACMCPAPEHPAGRAARHAGAHALSLRRSRPPAPLPTLWATSETEAVSAPGIFFGIL